MDECAWLFALKVIWVAFYIVVCSFCSVDYEYAVIYLFILLLMDIWIVSSFRLF